MTWVTQTRGRTSACNSVVAQTNTTFLAPLFSIACVVMLTVMMTKEHIRLGAVKRRCSSAHFQSGFGLGNYDTIPTELPRPSLRHQASPPHAPTLLTPPALSWLLRRFQSPAIIFLQHA
jgi:hypothetical protein